MWILRDTNIQLIASALEKKKKKTRLQGGDYHTGSLEAYWKGRRNQQLEIFNRGISYVSSTEPLIIEGGQGDTEWLLVRDAREGLAAWEEMLDYVRSPFLLQDRISFIPRNLKGPTLYG